MSQKRFTEALWQEVWRQPWSMQVRSVLGDALLEAGDLHGELIHVQLALERLPDDDDESEAGDLREVRAALMAREQQLLKCLRPLLLARNHTRELTWRAGFLDSVELAELGELTTVLECKAAWVLRSLTFLGLLDDFEDVVHRFRDGRGATIEELIIGGRNRYLGCERRFLAEPLITALPRLKRLELWCCSADFSQTVAYRLEHLVVDPAWEAPMTLQTLASANCPALKSMVISSGDWGLPAALLESNGFPALEALRLEGDFQEAQVKAVLEGQLCAKVKRLSVHVREWVEWPHLHFDWGSTLDKLESFELWPEHLSDEEIKALEHAHPKLKVRFEP